jgi:hypothetical protein
MAATLNADHAEWVYCKAQSEPRFLIYAKLFPLVVYYE